MELRIDPPGEEELAKLLEALVAPEPGKSYSLFKTKQKALMFAAVVGWREKRRVPLERRGEGIRYEVFQKWLDDGFVDALAVADSRDLRILAPERAIERARIFEEYAHGGLLVIRDVRQSSRDLLIQLLAVARESPHQNSTTNELKPDLARLFGV